MEEKIVTDFAEATGLYKRKTRFVYYLLVVSVHIYMQMWSRQIFPVPITRHLCYLTNMSFYLNFIYYTYVFLLHTPIRERIKNYNLLKGISKFAYTLSFVVFVLYWGMIIADPTLLMKKGRIIPFGLDLFLHGANYGLNLIEHVYLFPKGDSHHVSYFFYTLFMAFYGCLLQFVYNFYGMVIYPFVELGFIQYSVINLIGLGLVLIGDFSFKMLLKKHHKYPQKQN